MLFVVLVCCAAWSPAMAQEREPISEADVPRDPGASIHHLAGAEAAIVDPKNDRARWDFLVPAPNPRRGTVVSGKSVTFAVPIWTLGSPASFYWGAQSFQTNDSDIASSLPVAQWSAAAGSSISDPAGDAPVPGFSDLTQVVLSPLALGAIKAKAQVAAVLPGPGSYPYVRFFRDGKEPTINIRNSSRLGMRGYVLRGTKAWPYLSFPWEDIVKVSVTAVNESFELAMEVQSAIPASPPTASGNPAFVWQFDTDGDDVHDVNVQLRFNAVTRVYDCVLRKRHSSGFYFVDRKKLQGCTLVGKRLTASVSKVDAGIAGTFQWFAQTAAQVGPANEEFTDTFDVAPNSGFVVQN